MNSVGVNRRSFLEKYNFPGSSEKLEYAKGVFRRKKDRQHNSQTKNIRWRDNDHQKYN